MLTHRAVETQFLPAALELQHTPPLPLACWILRSIMIFFSFALVWSVIGKVDIVATAQGQIVASGHTRRVQSSQAGVVSLIRVAAGDRVLAGDLLLELDDTAARADLNRMAGERDRTREEHVRLQMLVKWLNAGRRPEQFSRLSRDERFRTESEYRHFEAESSALEEERRRNRAERATVEARIARLDATLPLLAERTEALNRLQRKSLAPRAGWLELKEQHTRQAGEREVLVEQLAVSDAAFAVLEQRGRALTARTEARWREAVAETEKRLAGYAEEIRKAEWRVAGHRIRAPVNGTVQELALRTEGVVSPGQQLMLIVPSEGGLHVEAHVLNKDIGFVGVGEDVAIKIETFPFTTYGTVGGRVQSVSGDAIEDDKLGPVYLARIGMRADSIRVGENVAALTPGMAVTVEANLGERRVIEFLLAPLLRYRDDALTER